MHVQTQAKSKAKLPVGDRRCKVKYGRCTRCKGSRARYLARRKNIYNWLSRRQRTIDNWWKNQYSYYQRRQRNVRSGVNKLASQAKAKQAALQRAYISKSKRVNYLYSQCA